MKKLFILLGAALAAVVVAAYESATLEDRLAQAELNRLHAIERLYCGFDRHGHGGFWRDENGHPKRTTLEGFPSYPKGETYMVCSGRAAWTITAVVLDPEGDVRCVHTIERSFRSGTIDPGDFNC